jgi:twitching motility protein PilJ
MNTTNATQNITEGGRLPVVTRVRGLWLAFAWLGLLGLGVGLGWGQYRHQGELQQTQERASARTQVEALRTLATQAGQGQLNAADWIPLQSGLSASAQRLAVPSLQALLNAVQPWPVSEVGRGQAALGDLRQGLPAWRDADAALARQSSLTSGTWGATLTPIRTELGSIDPAALVAVFAPDSAHTTLQGQWGDRLDQYAQSTQALANQASQDTALTAVARQAVQDWATAWSRVAKAAQALAQTNAARAQAQGWSRQIAPLALAAAQDLGTAPSPSEAAVWVIQGGSLGLAVLGLALIGWDLRRQRAAAQLQGMQGQRSRAALAAVERLTVQMRQVIGRDGEVVGRSKVNEDTRSPAFALASMINQVLGANDALALTIDRQQGRQGRELDGVQQRITELTHAARQRQEQAEHDRRTRLTQAQSLATLGQQAARLQTVAAQVTEGFHQAQSAVQETIWKSEGLRENTQSQAKRLKRLSESTQSISVTADTIQQIFKRIQVLSINTAIEASTAGPGARNLAVLAQEIESLAQGASEALQEINTVVRDIQDDAKITVAAMEKSTGDVVEAGKRASQASTFIVDIERAAKSIDETLSRVVDALEQRAVEDAQSAEEAKGTQAALGQMVEQALGVEHASRQSQAESKEAFAQLRASLTGRPLPPA